MTTKSYKDLMEHIFKMQINYIKEDVYDEDDEYTQGKIAGIMIAIQKLKDSEFLLTDE